MSYRPKPIEPLKVIQEYKRVHTEEQISFGDYIKIPDGVTHIEVEEDYGDKNVIFYLATEKPNPDYEKQLKNYEIALRDYHIKQNDAKIKEAEQLVLKRLKLYEELKKEFETQSP